VFLIFVSLCLMICAIVYLAMFAKIWWFIIAVGVSALVIGLLGAISGMKPWSCLLWIVGIGALLICCAEIAEIIFWALEYLGYSRDNIVQVIVCGIMASLSILECVACGCNLHSTRQLTENL